MGLQEHLKAAFVAVTDRKNRVFSQDGKV